MEKIGRYTAIFFCALQKDCKYWLGIMFLCLGLLFLFQIKLPEQEKSFVGVICPDTPVAEAVFQSSKNGSAAFLFERYSDRTALEKDLFSGKLDCGFIVSEDFDGRVRAGDLRESILYISTPFTTKGALVKEYLFAGILQQYSPVLLKSEMLSRLQNQGDAAELETFLEKESEAYLQSELLFSVEVISVTDNAKDTDSLKNRASFVIRGMAGILLFLFLAFEMLEKRAFSYAGFLSLLDKKNRRSLCIASYIAASAIPCFIMIFSLSVWEQGYALPVQIRKGIVFWLAVGIYILILWICRLKKEYIAVTVLGLSLLWVIINPVFTDFSVWIPAMRYLRILTPLYWIL